MSQIGAMILWVGVSALSSPIAEKKLAARRWSLVVDQSA
jgi:hypothetical protein